MIVMGLFFAIGIKFMGKDMGGFLKGFPLVFIIAVVAYMLVGQMTMMRRHAGRHQPIRTLWCSLKPHRATVHRKLQVEFSLLQEE